MDALPIYRSARAFYPIRDDAELEALFLYEPLLPPVDHPELPFAEEWMGHRIDEVDLPEVKKGLSPERLEEPMPSRMLNEFVYCPRLFYYEFVDGVFVENADTERGTGIHKRVDRGKGALPAAKKSKGKGKAKSAEGGDALGLESGTEVEEAVPEESDVGEGEVITTIHSRSVSLSSDRLGVIAKMDLIEVQLAASHDGVGGVMVAEVTPVDYKAGAPRAGEEEKEMWDTDKMQLGLQILILRDNGYRCEEGVIFYRATKQRVRLMMTPEVEAWILDRIQAARATAMGGLPPPLVNSPKCVRCSLAPVCLPDETRLLRRGVLPIGDEEAETAKRSSTEVPRRLIAARDDARALYLNTPGVRVGCKDELLVVKDGDLTLDEIRTNDVTHVALFGNIQLSTQALQMLCEKEIPIAYFSMGGWFYGLTRGHGMKNVFTRIEQFRAAEDEPRCLALARRFVHGKIRNQRTLLMRLHVEAPTPALLRLKQAAQDVLAARSLAELLGMEGAAAALYFQHFGGMIKIESEADDDELPGLEGDAEKNKPEEPPAFTFDFTRRKRRPPTDPVNALLSLAYSLLSKDCTITAHAVGFDPYVGFYHQPRFGRPALALDLMEEFRPLIAESTVLTALNNRMITPGHFVRAGDAVNLTPAGRKVFFQAYEQRMNTLITHPIFDYKVSYRRVLELQARILARHLTGEISEYVPMVTR
jgi:CRISPR-associated protein Cas1